MIFILKFLILPLNFLIYPKFLNSRKHEGLEKMVTRWLNCKLTKLQYTKKCILLFWTQDELSSKIHLFIFRVKLYMFRVHNMII